MTLYHRYIYMPPKVDNLKEQTIHNLNFTSHAIRELENDDLQFFDSVTFSGKQIIEAEIINNVITQILVELKHSRYQRKYVVIVFEGVTAVVRTVYLRSKERDMALFNKTPSAMKKYYRPINMSEVMF